MEKVSLYQLIVLLLFNETPNWTVEQIQDKTQIKCDLLIPILCNLFKSKILVCTEISKDFQETDIKMNYMIQLANNFTR
jgi:hypothetical protein